MEVSAQLHATAALTSQRKRSRYPLDKKMGERRAGLKDVKEKKIPFTDPAGNLTPIVQSVVQ
jgi:hypothetical protein